MVINQVILVDENDKEIGQIDKTEAHVGNGQRHRAVSVLLLNDNKELLLQKRSNTKIVEPDKWANTCCGNIMVGETYEECAKRRLKEELGITNVELMPVKKFEYHINFDNGYSEWEIDQVFTGNYNGKITPNKNEVSDYKYISKGNLLSQIKNNPAQFAKWFLLIIKQEEIWK